MKNTWKRSKPIVNIAKGHLEKIPFFQGKNIHGLNLFQTGLRNTNYEINADLNSYVLRIIDDPTTFKIEHNVIKLVENEIPVPKIIDTGSIEIYSKTYDYILMEYIPGIVLSEILQELTDEERLKVYHNAGKLLGKIVSFTFDTSGFFDEDLGIDQPLENSHMGYSKMFEMLILEEGVKEHLDDLYLEILEFIDQYQYAIRELPDTITLSHSDFNPENIIVDGETLEINGIIDWEFALAINPFFDVGNFIRFDDDLSQPEIQAFIEPIMESNYEWPKHWQIIARLYDLIALISMLNGDKIDKYKLKDIRDRISHYLQEFETD